MAAQLSHCAEQARLYDRDRFLCCLFAPSERRESLFALLAFNHEIAKTRDVVSESLLGEVRLQWWDDAIESILTDCPDLTRLRGNLVLDGLAQAIQRWGLSGNYFTQLIDGRRQDLSDEPFADPSSMVSYAEQTSASLSLLMSEVLTAGMSPLNEWQQQALETAVRHIGIGWALLGQIRAIPYRLESGRIGLPLTALRDAGIEPHTPVAEIRGERLSVAVEPVVMLARSHFLEARRVRGDVPRSVLPALLPGRLADDYLVRLHNARYDVFNPRIERGQLRRQIGLYISAVRGVY
ncbi:MAG: phytoene/squalene synthase family protein [Proteobacteria bacterium]|nr:phytoene/squalene synthase family protein [Pseudomonadota bacterium]